ncbi:MAG: NAD-dependent epimerase/dehydratase family protein [Firmicutes bacterium]|nr:NAD-dependent epimerase/dehydratase family protein [Bacillota bacterium]
MEKVYIVTGGTGFVGNNLVKELESRGENVVVLAQSREKAEKALVGSGAKIIFGSIMNVSDLEALFEIHSSAQYIFIHTASVVYLGRNKQRLANMYETNIQGTQNVVDVCIRHGARLVYVSSVHAIPETPKRGVIVEVNNFNPKKVVGNYAKSKAEASQMVLDAVRERELDAVLVHPSGIVGPNDYSDTHLTQMVEDYQNGRIPASVKGGYDFVDVRDVMQGTLAVAERGVRGEGYLLTGEYSTVRNMLDTLCELGAGRRVRMRMPLWVAKVGLPFLTMYFKVRKRRPLYSRYSLYTLGSNSNFSNAKAKEQLGYTTRPLKESLQDMVRGTNE